MIYQQSQKPQRLRLCYLYDTSKLEFVFASTQCRCRFLKYNLFIIKNENGLNRSIDISLQSRVKVVFASTVNGGTEVSLTGLERHEGDYLMTEFSCLGELIL